MKHFVFFLLISYASFIFPMDPTQETCSLSGSSAGAAAISAFAESLENLPVELWIDKKIGQFHNGRIPLLTFHEETPCEPHARIHKVTFSPDSRLIAAALSNGSVDIWALVTNKKIQSIKHGEHVFDIAFNHTGTHFATAADNKTAALWELSNDKPIKTFLGHENWLTSIEFNPQIDNELTTGSQDHTARIWCVETGDIKNILSGHSWGVEEIAYSDDGIHLFTAGYDGVIIKWDPHSATMIAQYSLPDDRITSLTFSPLTHTIITGLASGLIKQHDGIPAHITQSYKGHLNMIKDIAPHPFLDIFVSASLDTTVHMWTSHKQDPIQTLPTHMHPDDARAATSAAFSPDGMYLATAADDYKVRLWKLSGDHAKILNDLLPLQDLLLLILHTCMYSVDDTQLAAFNEKWRRLHTSWQTAHPSKIAPFKPTTREQVIRIRQKLGLSLKQIAQDNGFSYTQARAIFASLHPTVQSKLIAYYKLRDY